MRIRISSALLIGSLLLSDAALAQQGSLQQPAPSSARAARKDTSLKIQELFEQAHQALRTNRRGDAVAPMQQAIALAERFPPGDQKRIEALSQAGTLLWSVNRKELAEASLLAAVKQMEFSPKAASPETSRATFHMLGVIYRDERRHVDAIPWFQRAVDVSATLPDAHPEETETKFFALASELRALAWAQCRADDPQAADATDQRRIEACTRLRRPGSVNECRDGKRTCVGRWMSQSH